MAEQLFYQTDLTKTQIADCLGINRRTLTNWASDNHWDRIRTSARHMPALIAENLYIAIAHLTNSVVAEDRINKPITDTESKILHRLILDVNKLKNRSTLNENLEMLRYFMEFVEAKDPNAIDTIQPFVNEYIKSRARVQPGQFLPPGFNDYGFMPKKEDDLAEHWKDIHERMTSEDYPDPYQSGPETPITAAGPGFIPNSGQTPILKAKQPNTIYQTSSELKSIATFMSAAEREKQSELENDVQREAEEITEKELIRNTYQNLKQQNLNRAARRKLAQSEARKTKSHS